MSLLPEPPTLNGMYYADLRDRLIRPENVQYFAGAWRYVSHVERLASTGFSTQEGLVRNSDIIRFSPLTVSLMAERYEHEAQHGNIPTEAP